MLLIRQGGGDDRRGPFGEFGDRDGSTAGKGPRDGRINLDAHGLEVRQRGLELIALIDIAPFRGATAEGRRDEAASHLAIVTGAHLTDVLVETGGTLLLECLKALFEVGPLSDGIGRSNQRTLQRLNGRGKDAVEGVIVRRWNRVELMVMATGAGDREPEEGLRRGVDALVNGIILIIEALADGDEAEGREPGVFFLEVGQAIRR